MPLRNLVFGAPIVTKSFFPHLCFTGPTKSLQSKTNLSAGRHSAKKAIKMSSDILSHPQLTAVPILAARGGKSTGGRT